MTRDTTPFSSIGFDKMLLSVQQRAKLLEKSPFGKDLEWDELESLAGYTAGYSVAAESVICRQGDTSAFLSIVCRGRVDIVREDLGHKQKIIASIGPGNTLGEMSLIDGEPRSATAVAHAPVELLVLTAENHDQLAEENPRLWGKLVVRIACVISRRLRRTSGILAEYLES